MLALDIPAHAVLSLPTITRPDIPLFERDYALALRDEARTPSFKPALASTI